MKAPIFRRLGLYLSALSLLIAGCSTLKDNPTLSKNQTPAPAELDDWLGPYAPERLWGNPREALKGDGWSFGYNTALVTPYQTGEDGIASLTDKEMNALLTWAFYTPAQPYLTERLYGLDGPNGEYGETVKEDRVFLENTPDHSYMRYRYTYPFEADFAQVEIEYAKQDGRSMVAQINLTGLANASNAPLFLIPEVINRTGKLVERKSDGTFVAQFKDGVLAVIPEAAPQAWQITQNSYANRAQISAALVNTQVLTNEGKGNKAAWQYTLNLTPGESQALRFGIGYASNANQAIARANSALKDAASVLATRESEAQGLYRGDVSAHQDLYQAALMNLLWNKMYYAYDGSYQAQFLGAIDIHDVILVPDKWEFPWPAMWDTCFQAKVATLADISLAKHDLSLFLSDRWQTKTGHMPNVEWDLMGETPPLFAWAAWQIYQADGDRAFLETVFPQLESHYAYVRKAYDRDKDALHTGGFMGMDNIPRPGNPNEEEADLSGWVAFFAQDMQRIAAELGKTDRADFYQTQYQTISATINEQLWDVETGFYYDRNDNGFLMEKSYAGLIPFIAGVSTPAQTEDILATLSDPMQFWSEYGVRSLSAQSDLYEPGYSVTGWKNSNWRGPVWMPINYLLVQRLEEVDPVLADQLRENLIAVVERNWQETGRFYEYYDAETGKGIGADHQTGWTALVANLIWEKYHQ